jgi:hypothetical protein
LERKGWASREKYGGIEIEKRKVYIYIYIKGSASRGGGDPHALSWCSQQLGGGRGIHPC